MKNGKIVQIDTPEEPITVPADKHVEDFNRSGMGFGGSVHPSDCVADIIDKTEKPLILCTVDTESNNVDRCNRQETIVDLFIGR